MVGSSIQGINIYFFALAFLKAANQNFDEKKDTDSIYLMQKQCNIWTDGIRFLETTQDYCFRTVCLLDYSYFMKKYRL